MILNFHGIGAPSREFEPGEEPYWISLDRFREILDLVEATEAQTKITFDDGNASDFLIAVPELRARRMAATFFVLAGRLDEPGYLSTEHVREMAKDCLFAIGSHGLFHRAWPTLCDTELSEELSQSRAILTELCGRPIEEVGLPFGHYDRRTLHHIAASGYTRIYSSDGVPGWSNRMPIARFSVRRDTPPEYIRAMLQRPRIAARLATELRVLAKGLA